MKKLFSLVLALALMSTMFVTASAASSETMPTTMTVEDNVLVLNDPALLAKADTVVESAVNNAAARGLFITLKNRTLRGQYFYGDVPFLVDSVEGPMATGPKITFKTEATIGANLNLGVSESNIEASFGVSFKEVYSLERVYQFDPIPNGKWLNYKAYTNYSVYDFEVYDFGNYVGTSSYWVPVGIVVEHNLT